MRSIKLCLIGRQRPEGGGTPFGLRHCRGRSWPLLVTCNPMQAPPKVTDVRMRNAFFHSIGSLPGGLCPLDKSSAAAARQRVHRTRLPLDRCPRSRAATANTVFFMARIDRVGEVYSKPAKKPMPAGTPGDGLSQSTAIIRGYAPDTPYGVIATYTPPQSRYAE